MSPSSGLARHFLLTADKSIWDECWVPRGSRQRLAGSWESVGRLGGLAELGGLGRRQMSWIKAVLEKPSGRIHDPLYGSELLESGARLS